jgi:CHASE3 domain sensor protein
LFVPCLLAASLAAIGIRAERRLAHSNQWVSHTIEVRRELQELRAGLLQAESGQRGYVLTAQDGYLQAYRSSVDQLPGRLTRLRSLTADNPVQQGNLRDLDAGVAAKMDFMAEVVSREAAADHAGALALVNTNRGRESMDAIGATLSAMEREEARLLAIREARLRSSSRFNSGFLFGLVALNVVFAFVMLLVFRRLSRIQGLVTVCAWSRTVEYEGTWLSFEQYLRRRFNLDTSHGISPAEAEKAFGPSLQPNGATESS